MARAGGSFRAWFGRISECPPDSGCGAGSNPAIARRSVKNIFCGSSPFDGKRFFLARLKTLFGGNAPPPRAGSFSGSNAGAPFSTLKENGFANHRFLPPEDSVSGENRLANLFFGRRKFLAPAGKAMRYPNAAATFRRFSPPNGSTRILNAPGTAREKDKINAGLRLSCARPYIPARRRSRKMGNLRV